MKFKSSIETKEAGIIILNRTLEKPYSPQLLLFINGETYIDSSSLFDMPLMRLSTKVAVLDDLLSYWQKIDIFALDNKYLLVPLDATLRELGKICIKHKSISALGASITIILTQYHETLGKMLSYGKDYGVTELVEDLYQVYFEVKRSYKDITKSMAKIDVNPATILVSPMDKALFQFSKWIE